MHFRDIPIAHTHVRAARERNPPGIRAATPRLIAAVWMVAAIAVPSGAAAQEPTDSLRAELARLAALGRQLESRGGPPERGPARSPRPTTPSPVCVQRRQRPRRPADSQLRPKEPRIRSSWADSAPFRPSTRKSASTPISSGISTRTMPPRTTSLRGSSRSRSSPISILSRGPRSSFRTTAPEPGSLRSRKAKTPTRTKKRVEAGSRSRRDTSSGSGFPADWASSWASSSNSSAS